MIPVMDLGNHSPTARVSWTSTSTSITLSSDAPLLAGDVVMNNYGAKSNESLLMSYGFCLKENEMDVFGVEFRLGGGAILGPFYVARKDGSGEQFPTELWRALDDPGNFVEGEGGEGPVEVDLDSAEMLLAALTRKLGPFQVTAAYDEEMMEGDEADMRPAFVAMYRCGQRRVLEEAVETLEEMLEAAEG